jgi:hypothetical protein
MGDEISGGAGPAPRRTRTVLLVLVAAVVVVAGIVSLRRGVQEPVARPPASPPAVQVPRLPGQLEPPPTGSLSPVPALSLGEVCQPVRTDGRTTLDVSFTLVNTVDSPVTLVRVAPLFPLRGLRARSTEIRAGSCAAPGPKLTGGDVRGHGTVLVILRLGLLGDCPSPLPVQATVAERHAGRLVTSEVHLLNDLGTLYFTTC